MQHRYRSMVLTAVLPGVIALAGCTKEEPKENKPAPANSTPVASAPVELNLMIWPDYIGDQTIKEFEKANNARLRLTRYDSTEDMESKLAYAGAESQYDVVVMASQVLPRLVRRGLVRPLDHSQLPNLKNLEERFSGPKFDDGNKYGVPYQWGTVGLLYDKKKLPSLDRSWSVVLDPQKLAGTFELLDELRDMLGVVLKYKGYSSNTTSPEEIREAGRVIKEVKDNKKCLGFKGGVGAVQDVKGGSVDLAIVWNGDAQKAIQEDKDQRLAFVIPKEGSVLWVDVMTVTPKAPHPELAHKFINFMLSPEAGAELSVYTKYATPNAAAREKLPAEDRNNVLIYPTKEDSEHLEHHGDIGEAAKIFDEVWTAVKSH